VLTNAAHLDPRMMVVPGTPPDEPEALLTLPLIARDSVKGVLSIYRLGAHASFDAEEFELAKRFGDGAALALDNTKTRARRELQAQTDDLRELIACAEARMMTAKDLIVLFDESTYERPTRRWSRTLASARSRT